MLYLCSATLKRYEAEGRQSTDAPLMHWAIWDAMFKAQNAVEGVISNFPNRALATVLRRIVFPLGRPYVVPSDRLGHDVARLLIESSATRDRLTAGIYLPKTEAEVVGALDLAVEAALAAEPIEARMRDAAKAGRFSMKLNEDRIAAAQAAGVISADEANILRRASRLVNQVVRVDDFAQDLGASEMRLTSGIADADAHRAAA
jgi:acyl-CoA dehydrogenase